MDAIESDVQELQTKQDEVLKVLSTKGTNVKYKKEW